MQLNKFTQLAISAAVLSGKEILKIYHSNNFKTQYKKDKSPITEADKLAHNLISAKLKKTNIPILSEEGKHIDFKIRKEWSRLWVIDPIDGTKEFIKKNDEFTVNIALVEENRPILGVVFAPAIGVLYFCQSKKGAYKTSIDLNNFDVNLSILDSKRLPLKQVKSSYTIITSRSHLSKETISYINFIKKEHKEIKIIKMGSSLKICKIAEGAADNYPRLAPTMEWDIAAAHAICSEAGFRVLDYKTGEELLYNKETLVNNWFNVLV